MAERYTEICHVLDAVEATTTSQPVNIEDATRVTFVFKRSDHSAGKTVFSVTVSVDGTNYITYNKLIDNVANANTETLTRVSEFDTGAANVTATYSMDLTTDVFRYVKVTATETTDGTHDAWILIQHN